MLVVDRDRALRARWSRRCAGSACTRSASTLPIDAVALLDGIEAEVVLVRAAESPDGDELAMEELRRKTPLVVVTEPLASPEEAVVELLRALGRPEEAAHLN